MSIKAERKRAGMTQMRLSSISGVSREQINKYERGKMKPDLNTLMKIRDALKCTLDDLVKEEDDGAAV